MAGTEPSKLTLSRQWMQTRESPVLLTKAFFGLKLSSWTSFFLGADLGFPLGQAILTSFVASIGWDIKDNFHTLFCQNLGRLNYFAIFTLPFFLLTFVFRKFGIQVVIQIVGQIQNLFFIHIIMWITWFKKCMNVLIFRTLLKHVQFLIALINKVVSTIFF